MLDFWQWVKQYTSPGKSWWSVQVDEYTVHILRNVGVARTRKLDEARSHGTPLGGQYSAQLHPPHGGQGMQHLHAYAGNNQIFALNIDGTAHDKSHGVKIPNKVAAAIRQRFPSFKIPPNNYIEYADDEAENDAHSTLLLD